MAIRVVITGDEALIRRFANTPTRLARVVRAMDAHEMLIWGAVVPLTPVGVTSLLRGSWQTETMFLGPRVIGVVGSPLIYSEVIEHGRRPGAAMPPPDAIARWVAVKMGSDVSPFVVARSIGAKGIEGREMLRKAVELTRPAASSIWSATVRTLLEGS